MNFFAKLFANIGLLTADASTTACPWFYLDEPKMPNSMIK